MKKSISAAIIALMLMLYLTPTATAAEENSSGISQYEQDANKLKDLGLFLGTSNGFELERAPTRLEGLIMLIRLMGEDVSAKECSYSHPFKDVPAWGDRYVAWAYSKGYTSGTSATTFSPSNNMSANEYFAFVLRALGYGNDFVWPHSVEKAKDLNIIPATAYSDSKVPFLRADVAHISYLAMTAKSKVSGEPLYYELIAKGAIPAVDTLALFDPIYIGSVDNSNSSTVSSNDESSQSFAIGSNSAVIDPTNKVYSYTNTNNDTSRYTVSISGNTLTVTGVEKTGVSYVSLNINGQTGSEVYNWNSVGYTETNLKSTNVSLSLEIPDFKYGSRYEVVVGTSKDRTFSHQIEQVWLKGGKNNWYFEGPRATTNNDSKFNAVSNAPKSKWLDDAPTGTLADKIRTLMPETGSTNYDVAYNIYSWITKNIKPENYPSSTNPEWAIDNKIGNCDSSSLLMVKALNLYGIPARQVMGPIIYGDSPLAYDDLFSSTGPEIDPNDPNWYEDYLELDFASGYHAWVEFQDDNGNWVVCDTGLGLGNLTDGKFDVNRAYIANGMRIDSYK